MASLESGSAQGTMDRLPGVLQEVSDSARLSLNPGGGKCAEHFWDGWSGEGKRRLISFTKTRDSILRG